MLLFMISDLNNNNNDNNNNMKMIIVPIVIGALGSVAKGLFEGPGVLESWRTGGDYLNDY